MAGQANFSVVKGDTFRRTCTFRNKTSGTPVNLTGATIVGKAGQENLTCTIANAAQGQFKFELSPTQSANLATGINKIEVQVTYADGTVQTLFTGNLNAVEQYV
jgi:hypothetical protein